MPKQKSYKQYVQLFQISSGVLGVFVLWVGVVLSMFRTNLGLVDPRPLSHLGIEPASKFLFNGSLIISALLFVVFGLYLKRQYKIKNNFLAFMLIGQVAQIIAALSPYGQQQPYRSIHTISAFVLAFSLPLLMQQFAASQRNKPHHTTFLRLLRFEQISFVVGIGLFIFTKGIAPIGEALPAIAYHAWIIYTTLVLARSELSYTMVTHE